MCAPHASVQQATWFVRILESSVKSTQYLNTQNLITESYTSLYINTNRWYTIKHMQKWSTEYFACLVSLLLVLILNCCSQFQQLQNSGILNNSSETSSALQTAQYPTPCTAVFLHQNTITAVLWTQWQVWLPAIFMNNITRADVTILCWTLSSDVAGHPLQQSSLSFWYQLGPESCVC